jgi:hypothetical protein
MLQRNMPDGNHRVFAGSEKIGPQHRKPKSGFPPVIVHILHAYCIEKCPVAAEFILSPISA